MKIHNFAMRWTEIYYSERKSGLKKAKLTSYFIIPLCVLQILNLRLMIEHAENSLNYEVLDGTVRALTFQLTIVAGLLVRFLALRFEGKYASRFADVGILVAFSAWLAHFVWTIQWIREISKIADVCPPPILFYTLPLLGWLLTYGFFGWFLYKIIFLIAVTWKTVRK